MALENVDTSIKSIDQYLSNSHTIAIIGIAKNAGKTTVLNKIIDAYKDKSICVTSIGLDGEELDHITNQQKPRIKLYPGMYLITAKECLQQSTCQYRLLEETTIRSALGVIVIVEVTAAGLALVAGPSSKQQMKNALELLAKYKPYKVLIDGALFRKSIASTMLTDGVIFVTGASYSNDMIKVVKDTKVLVDQLKYKASNRYEKPSENSMKSVNIYRKNETIIDTKITRFTNNEIRVLDYIDNDVESIYIPGALTDKLCEVLIHNNKLNDLEIVVQDASYILVDPEIIQKLRKKHINIRVLKPIDILFVAYNPTSPFNYSFDEIEFSSLLREEVGIEPINVMKDLR